MGGKPIKWPLLLGSLVMCQLAGVVGSVFTASAVTTWYKTLDKPPFNPPSWVFAPVWTILYILMGISLYLVLDTGFGRKGVKLALGVFALQLLLNVLWSYVFFGLRSPFGALIEIFFLWLSIIASIVLFYRVRPLAGYLMVPYLLWVSFASFLNFHLWVLNRGL